MDRIRELAGTGVSGTTLLALIRAGSELGLEIDGYQADIDALDYVEIPCILHVVGSGGGYHFVVFFGRADSSFLIVDPSEGVRKINAPEVEAIWKSRALLTVRPSETFVTRERRRREKRQWLIESIRRDTPQLTLSTLMGILISLFSLSGALFSQALIDDILPNEDALKLWVGLALVALFLLAQNLLSAGRQLILIRQARTFNNRIIRRFIDTLLHLPFSFFTSRRAGDLITRLNDTARLQRFVTYAVSGVVINILMLLTGFTFVAGYALSLGAWVLAGLLVLGTCAVISRGPIRRRQVDLMVAHAVNESRYVDSMRGIEAIKATNSEPFFARAMRGSFSAMQDAAYRLGRIGISFDLAAQSIGLVILLGVLGGGAQLVLRGTLQLGAFVALIQMTNILLPAAYRIAVSNIELQEASVAFDRVHQFSLRRPEYAQSVRPIPNFRFQNLDVEQLTFSFPGQPPLFVDASFHLSKGEFVLLGGGTGSGKSTLLRVLLRLYGVDRGRIRVDGRDWTEIDTSTWRRAVGMVPQEVQIFTGSVAENIAMRPLESIESVRGFCEELGLAHVFGGLPLGYETVLGEGGLRLSGGQQRLLALARALYRWPQLLLVDEPLAGLDRKSAELTMEILGRRRGVAATLVVTHRSTLLPCADRVYVLKDGGLRELDATALSKAASPVRPVIRSET